VVAVVWVVLSAFVSLAVGAVIRLADEMDRL
jgi:hypothetical protein